MSSYFIEEAERDKCTEAMYRWLEGEATTVMVAGRYEANLTLSTTTRLSHNTSTSATWSGH